MLERLERPHVYNGGNGKEREGGGGGGVAVKYGHVPTIQTKKSFHLLAARFVYREGILNQFGRGSTVVIVSCLLNVPVTCKVHLKDGPAQRVSRAATLR